MRAFQMHTDNAGNSLGDCGFYCANYFKRLFGRVVINVGKNVRVPVAACACAMVRKPFTDVWSLDITPPLPLPECQRISVPPVKLLILKSFGIRCGSTYP